MKNCSSVCLSEKYSMEFLMGLANAYRKWIFPENRVISFKQILQAQRKGSWRESFSCQQCAVVLCCLRYQIKEERISKIISVMGPNPKYSHHNLREKDGEQETRDMTDPLTISFPLKCRLFLLFIKDLNEYFYSEKCS